MSQNTNIEKVSQAIETAINECGIRSISKLPAFMQAIRMAQGIAALRGALTDSFVQTTLMPLQGTALGFLTDKDKDGGYGVNVVRDCAIEAMLRGFNVVGNEFNIIAGRFYGTKAGFERQVASFPGLRNLVLQPGVPELKGGDRGAVVPYTATWIFQGQDMRLDCQLSKEGIDQRIPVKVNAGMGADAVIGKATRKILHRIYQRINGSSYGLVDGEVGDEPLLTTGEPAPSAVPVGTPEGKRIKLGGKKTSGASAQPAETKGAAAPEGEAKEAATPLPTASAPAAAPADPAAEVVDIVDLHEALAQIDNEWAARGMGTLIEAWTEDQRLAALTWANAVIHDGPMQIQSRRPLHTLVSARQPGED